MPETAATGSAWRPASGIATLVVDDECTCVEASMGACAILGARRSELLGGRLADLFEPASRERFEHVWRAFSSGGGQAGPFELAREGSPEIAVGVSAEVLPHRHLIVLDDAGGSRPVHAASNGGAVPAALGSARSRFGAAREPSARERQILGMLAGGATDGQIAARLELSPATVQTHVRNAKAKLGARTRAQAVAVALQGGLIEAS